MLTWEDPRAKGWIEAHLPGNAEIVAPLAFLARIDEAGEIVAVLALSCYTGPDVEISLAGPPSREMLHAAGAYMFGPLDCCRASITTAHGGLVRLALTLGGRVEGLKRSAYGPGEDAWLVGILRDEWRLPR